MSARTLHYLTDWTDEVMPCAPTLEGWAAWLAEPDPDWNRHAAEESGAEFAGFTLEVLADVSAEEGPDGWIWSPEPPTEATRFYPYWSEPGGGWAAELSSDSLAGVLANCEDDEPPVWIACVRDGCEHRYRFEVGADGPVLIDLGPVS